MKRLTKPELRLAVRLVALFVLGLIGLAHVGTNGPIDQTVLIVSAIIAIVFPQLAQDYVEARTGNDE